MFSIFSQVARLQGEDPMLRVPVYQGIFDHEEHEG